VKIKKTATKTTGQGIKPLDAYSAIKELIFKGILNPGQKLIYSDLSQMIQLSKTPITNALNMLAYEGFVEYETNKGYRIKRVDQKEINDLFEIRIAIETLNVKDAIRKFSKDKQVLLKEKLRSLSEYDPPYTDRKKLFLDKDLHIEIARMGENQYSIMFLNTIIENIFFRYRLERGLDSRKGEIELEHRRIVEAIGKRDERGAVKHMQVHLTELQKLMLQYLREMMG
jgi:DNA-binding GntR family transcriptional regulator